MGRIRVMDSQLSNMIAAGEVVERPASVVKELVENAIDAGARRVDVEIEEGGIQSIRISDDGCGMDRDDCVCAFERHATSKISSTRDLFHIRTLGFRGEALPSIASVAKVELRSSESSGQIGTKVVVEGGQVTDVSDVAGVKGTEILVRDLFYNTPARLKYLKSISTEVGHITDFMNRLALTKADIAFSLVHNGKTILQTNGDGKLLHSIASIYGVQVAKRMLPVSGESLDFRWNGFVSGTEVTRASRSYLSLLINGRYIRSHYLNNAVMRGYHTLLPTGRYPIVILQIEMDPALVDVNVHPAKLEVRFSKEQELCEQIEQSIRTTLRENLSIVQPLQAENKWNRPRERVVQSQFSFAPAYSLDRSAPTSAARIRETSYQPPAVNWGPSSTEPMLPISKEDIHHTVSSAEQSSSPMRTTGEVGQSTDSGAEADVQGLVASRQMVVEQAEQMSETIITDRETSNGKKYPAAEEKRSFRETFADEQPIDRERSVVPELYPVGQVHGTYIVAQNETGMYLIDQHAAQERIYYELFMEKLLHESKASQLLLFPHTVECTAGEEALLKQRLPLLHSCGLEIEWFGSRTFLVRAHPQWFPAGSELDVIDELIQLVLEAGDKEAIDIRDIREKAAIMMSCKAAIKANRYLTQAEMEALLQRLRETTSPFTCPHGRPIVVHFTSYDLEKMFKRVM
ncbi:DNA mismatch repair endonuclease MutL [Brevibacillus humidisoli]|uniref:DNA mismatch repair endonuclease MutL n=1 Tax=Brevibacillus humidisoli TaxID=2895522 RepID=UPI001E544E4E|nr:DNA mismatch repair endonuclease MutL [Brevibacillus humidisoli]UFJ42233.1 DNA mismatch repair endonuclease MutL [Brevibacillus humidisoli]